MRLRPALVCSLLAACTTGPAPAPAVAAPGDLVTAAGTLTARLVQPVHDPAQHAATCKPWHQVFAADGRQLTKDLGGLYEHHRGLFVGWNQVRCGGATHDFWHCRKGETQQVRQLTAAARPGEPQVLAIDWLRGDGQAVLHEERRLAARSLDAATTCVEVTLTLRAADQDVQLGGDPQHSGCQFRAVQDFAEAGASPVTYVRPTSAQGGKDDVWTDCRWIAAQLPFADATIGVVRVEHPDNPPATWSTRPYGRFGAMCTATVTKDRPLRLRFAYLVSSRPDLFTTWGRHPSEPFAALAERAFGD